MAFSNAGLTMRLRLLVVLVVVLVQSAACAVVEYNFNITWVWANPDGLHARPVIGINNHWPLPQINATVGDNVIINTWNSLGNQSTSLHFHGLFMNASSHMDGTSSVSQCAIRTGESFTYNFTVCNPTSPPSSSLPAVIPVSGLVLLRCRISLLTLNI